MLIVRDFIVITAFVGLLCFGAYHWIVSGIDSPEAFRATIRP